MVGLARWGALTVRKAEGEGEGEEEKMGQGLSMSQKLTLAYAALVGGNAFPPE